MDNDFLFALALFALAALALSGCLCFPFPPQPPGPSGNETPPAPLPAANVTPPDNRTIVPDGNATTPSGNEPAPPGDTTRPGTNGGTTSQPSGNASMPPSGGGTPSTPGSGSTGGTPPAGGSTGGTTPPATGAANATPPALNLTLPPGVAPNLSLAGLLLVDWSAVQMKFTYIGPQDKLVPSAGVSAAPFDLNRFTRTPGIDYSNDDLDLRTVPVTPAEMQMAGFGLLMLPFVTDGVTPDEPTVSFTVEQGGGTVEVLMTNAEASQASDAVYNSLTVSRANATALRIY